jgi:hypothetical protein
MAAPHLLLRPGARYRCFGDGLCCTDIHAIGPIAPREVVRLRPLSPAPLVRNEALGGVVVEPKDGACGNVGPEGCRIHAAHGLLAKPSPCRRFPYRITRTPLGRRVSTEHRCPCRTMGARPPLDLEDVLASVRDARGRIEADVIVANEVQLTSDERVSFEAWAALESALLARLAAGDDPLAALDAAPFPALDGVRWADVAHHYRGKLDGSACGDALAWFGDVILGLEEDAPRKLRQRPWSPSFDRAEARSPAVGAPAQIVADWLADELWSMEWTERGTFAHARADLATRAVVARTIAERLGAAGVRPDRAAAEGVLIAEMAGAAPLWRSVVRAFLLG